MAIQKSDLRTSLWTCCNETRGDLDAEHYRGYVLVLLFVKYVSDKFAGQENPSLKVPLGSNFSDMVALKGDREIGGKINVIVKKLADANDLNGVIDVADFNDPEKLGSGIELVERLSKGSRKQSNSKRHLACA